MCPRADHVIPAATLSDARNLQYLCRMWTAKKGAPHVTRPSKAASQPNRPKEYASVHCVRPAAATAAIPADHSAPTASPADVWVLLPHGSLPQRNPTQVRNTTLPKCRRHIPMRPVPMVIPAPFPSHPAARTPAAAVPFAPQACASIDALMDPSLDLLFTSFA